MFYAKMTRNDLMTMNDYLVIEVLQLNTFES
jgi:hypothetical protein